MGISIGLEPVAVGVSQECEMAEGRTSFCEKWCTVGRPTGREAGSLLSVENPGVRATGRPGARPVEGTNRLISDER